MKYREFAPPADLQHIVHFYWTLSTDNTAPAFSPFQTIANGCTGLIYHHTNNKLAFAEDGTNKLPRLFLYGQFTSHGALYMSPGAQIIGITFHPHILKMLFGLDANEVTDQAIDADLITPGLVNKLQQAETAEQCFQLFSTFLRQHIRQKESSNFAIAHSIDRIIQSGGNIPTHKLYKSLNISERQFERRFKQNVGLTPKFFSRVIRFKYALNQVRNNNYQLLSDIAFDNGYADQSHFTREFKEFAGLKPSGYRSREATFLCQKLEQAVAV
ncbi:AraC family transcriptional regulator [Fodinibius halophilus]|uniref:AraC family transcriptional regulator n=1 Tax=Fodinibius halophilus TaxID=1736908 RepID=A0A6M1SZK7_9BACT|nr:helix-turn-helix domain-containing protein [Fodinibius halophilus]NGP87097.1 AraC family transcriptional regulator [Fodinibius halophilus]